MRGQKQNNILLLKIKFIKLTNWIKEVQEPLAIAERGLIPLLTKFFILPRFLLSDGHNNVQRLEIQELLNLKIFVCISIKKVSLYNMRALCYVNAAPSNNILIFFLIDNLMAPNQSASHKLNF